MFKLHLTGGNAGIGRAAAMSLSNRARKSLSADAARRRAVKLSQRSSLGRRSDLGKTAVSKASDAKAMIQTQATFGRLDFAFNNAGVEQLVTPLSDQSEDSYDQIMDINVKGVWLSLSHEIPAMLKTGGGAIVNNCSVAGLVGYAGVPLYVASKHAVNGLTKSVALEYARQNVRVNAVAAGTIETRMYHDFVAGSPEAKQILEAGTPVGRVGQPEDIASIVIWLCSTGASFTTGQIFAVDGGYTAQ